MRCRKLLSLLLVAGLASAARAGEPDVYFPQKLTARDLLYACAASALTSQGRERQRYCRGFISGVEETLRYFRPGGGDGGVFCFPPGMTAWHYGDVYIKYASGRDVDLDRPAVVVVREAFGSEFSCARPDSG